MQFIYSFVSSVSVCSAGLADSSSEAVSAASVVSAGAASSERSVSGLGPVSYTHLNVSGS